MTSSKKESDQSNEQSKLLSDSEPETDPSSVKGPLSFLSGALTSVVLAVLCWRISKSLVVYFTLHSLSYSSPIAQNIASGFKTLIIGISFLATFSFSFIGLGLTLVFFRSLFDGKTKEST